MFKNICYLKERQYKTDNNLIDHKKLEYWEGLLGSEVCNRLRENRNNFTTYLKNNDYMVLPNGVSRALYDYLLSETREYEFMQRDLDRTTFAEFYKIILGFSMNKFRREINELQEWISDTVYESFEKSCINQMQKICTRTLIFKLHEWKGAGKLEGETSADEYEFFHERVVGKIEFILGLFYEFPVLYRCLMESIENLLQYFIEIILSYKADFEQIKGNLHLKKGEQKIAFISIGIGDGHNHGRHVLKIQLDYGTIIIYKPRSMVNEKSYDTLLRWFENKTGIEQFHYSYLSFENHSWCENVAQKTCESMQELEGYYKRFGVHLFLTWILGTRDLHFENIIAAGKYPVIVDLEMLLSDGSKKAGQTTVSEEILHQLSSSVLLSGLLPYYHWNRGGEGIDGSALCGGTGQTYPFKIAGIVNDKTSDMRIEYYHPRTTVSHNRASLKGIFYSPKMFEKQIVSGFLESYKAVLQNRKELMEIAAILKTTMNRFLAADTQRYSMLLNSSYHPSLLSDAAEREIFLYAIWTGRRMEDNLIVEAEVNEMLRGDIPLFCCGANDRHLRADNKVVIRNYFEWSAYESFLIRVRDLSDKDVQKQCDYIAVSLRMVKDETLSTFNKTYEIELEKINAIATNKIVELVEEKCQQLLVRILNSAVWTAQKNQVSWSTLHMSEHMNKTWNLTPMNMYLYDGLAGMLLVLSKAEKTGYCPSVNVYTEILRSMLFSYTDKGLMDLNTLHTSLTGAYEGEGSILHLYLLMYELTNDEEYVLYAKKHADILGTLLKQDQKYDLLSGNAGAALVLLKLFNLTKDKMYLEMAEMSMEVVMRTAIKQDSGIGWHIGGAEFPMSGMAHGNAGILMPVMCLWKLTCKQQYANLAEEIWQFENSLFNMKSNNWDDFHVENSAKDSIGAVSWCHGAPGILLSRMFCYECTDDEHWKNRLCKDMSTAYEKLRVYWRRDSWCLCHGNCGNLWILKMAETFFEREGIIASKEDFCAKKMNQICMNMNVNYLPQEIVNPGLFNGYGGILLYMLELLYTDEKIGCRLRPENCR